MCVISWQVSPRLTFNDMMAINIMFMSYNRSNVKHTCIFFFTSSNGTAFKRNNLVLDRHRNKFKLRLRIIFTSKYRVVAAGMFRLNVGTTMNNFQIVTEKESISASGELESHEGGGDQ